ncbi:hypothetical protein LIER_33723 [Lithospermum erythrorhizon]|uniref:Integrase zinc-binding domain-containing protein n=1 Tax=Lithospermum erythrorhizon TaxID=34254 RepID=A0AAV3S0R4_LITER
MPPLFEAEEYEEGAREESMAITTTSGARTDWWHPFIDYIQRSFREILLQCLSKVEAAQAMSEAHSGVCRAHQSGAKLQIKRMGYYWPTMVKDCMDYAQPCKPCQFHANFIHQQPESLHPTTVSWPFDSWGMDMVRPMLELT